MVRLRLLTLALVLLAAWAEPSAALGTPASPTPKGDSNDVAVARLNLFSAVAVAVITSLTSVVLAYIAIGKQKRVKQLEESSGTAGKKLEEQLLARYGFRAQSVFVVIEINPDGDAIITQGWKGLEIIQDVTLPSFPLRYSVGSPNGRLLPPPTLKPPLMSNGGKFPKDVNLVPREISEKRCVYDIEVTGALTRQDPPLDLITQMEIKLLYLMSNEAIAAAYKDSSLKKEYQEVESVTPTKHLELDVRFPAGFQVKAFPGVFLLGTETLHASELNRIRSGFEEVGNSVRLKVENPLPGFSYLIYWTPAR